MFKIRLLRRHWIDSHGCVHFMIAERNTADAGYR